MPTLEEVKSTLWPRAKYNPSLMVAGAAVKARKAYGVDSSSGKTIDYGALSDSSPNNALIYTPAGWVWFDTKNKDHRTLANSFSRVGVGWSFGNNSVHNQARTWFEKVYGREPNEMENFDLQYDGAWFNLLKAKAEAGIKEERPVEKPTDKPKEDKPKEEPKTDPKPDPTPTPTPTPIPIPVVPPNTLSPLSIRVEELRTSLGHLPDSSIRSFLSILFNSTAWPIVKPLAAELLHTYRLWRKSLGDTREIPKEN